MRPLIDEDLSVVFYDLTTVEVAARPWCLTTCAPTA
jgi:hypothetical protein